MAHVISEHFATLDCGSQVGMALSKPIGHRWAVRMNTDGEQLPGLEVPERYRVRLRARMRELIARKARAQL